MPLPSTELGRTGLTVSRVGLGLPALGRPGYINLGHADDLERDYDMAAMEAHAHQVLDAAWSAGIRYFDAARSYGNAEAFLASWLRSRRISPEEAVIGSKWGYSYTAGWRVEAEHHEIKDHSPDQLIRQLRESRALLGDHLDLYQIHSATPESGVLDNRPVLDELARLREGGLRIGLSVSGLRQGEMVERAMEVYEGGVRLFDCVQATWNLLEPSAGPALAAAYEAGVGVIVKEALANGRLGPRNRDTAFAPKRQLLEDEAGRLQTTVDALALAAVLARPWADVVLSGAAQVEHLSSNLGSLAVRWPESMDEQLQVVRESPEEYWATRSRLPWN
jgi:aryl-alcohol dehydrogenase-like predicted oxidoreductase